MTQLEQWQDDNNRYLAAAIAWLRALLEQRTDAPAGSGPLPTAASAATDLRPAWWKFGKADQQSRPSEPLLLPPAGSTNRKKPADDARAAMTKLAADMNPPPAAVILAKRLQLSAFEQNILLLCAAMEFDTGIASLCARAQHDPAKPYPTFALALTLFDEPAWDAMSSERGLRYWRLIEISQTGNQPLTVGALRADERIVNYLKGVSYVDDRLSPLVTRISPALKPEDVPPSQRELADTIAAAMKRPGGEIPVLQLVGTDTASKQLVAALACGSLSLTAYRLSTTALPAIATDRDALARLWQRESLLLPIALYLDASESDSETSAQTQSARAFVERLTGSVFLDVREIWPDLSRASLHFEVLKPTPEEQQAAWMSVLTDEDKGQAAKLAGQFDLNAVDIHQIASDTQTPIWDACLWHTRPRLGVLAHRIEAKAAWEDLVLPATEAALLRQIADQVGQRSTVYNDWGFRAKMSRGLGISALFSGPSGTGKTLAAEVLAASLHLDLYRIDLSAVVSKYIGETEKNLRKMFDAAEDGGAILFFDEADALFGKRTEVKDSHDRYANIEINYLLQRMEAYRGLAILATNMKSALDTAFLRRLRFIVSFAVPGVAERKAIWQRAFPPQTPAEDLDFDRLSKLVITGGNIHSIAVNAAFAAAHSGSRVTMPIVLDAARVEYRKLAKPINEAEFAWKRPAGAVA